LTPWSGSGIVCFAWASPPQAPLVHKKKYIMGTMFEIVSEHVFPFLRNMAEADTAHATHMKGARFTIPTPEMLGGDFTKWVDNTGKLIPIYDPTNQVKNADGKYKR
jgi:hypothetical protein